jgi:hypothetical protein
MKLKTNIQGKAKEIFSVTQPLAPYFNFDLSLEWNANVEIDEVHTVEIEFVYKMPGNNELRLTTQYASDMFGQGMQGLENAISEEKQGHRLSSIVFINRSDKNLSLELELSNIEPVEVKQHYNWTLIHQYALMHMIQEAKLFEVACLLQEISKEKIIRLITGDNYKTYKHALELGRNEMIALFDDELLKHNIQVPDEFKSLSY